MQDGLLAMVIKLGMVGIAEAQAKQANKKAAAGLMERLGDGDDSAFFNSLLRAAPKRKLEHAVVAVIGSEEPGVAKS